MSENNSNQDVYKDDIDDKNFRSPATLTLRVSLKAYFSQLLILSIIGLWLTKFLMAIPDTGLRIYDILGKPHVASDTNKFWLRFLSIKLTENQVSMPVMVLIGVTLFFIIYYILKAKTTKYTLNFRSLEIKSGILNTQDNTIDLVSIKDQVLDRSFIYRCLGLSKLTILSNDKSHPTLVITGARKENAQLFLDFIRQNSYQNATEYWVAKDRRRRNESKRTPSSKTVLDDDGNDE